MRVFLCSGPSLALGLALALAVVSACHRADDSSSPQASGEATTAPIHVQTATVSEQPMPEYLTLTGSLHASRQSDIAADANGKVLQALVERGQAVKSGQVIATLDARVGDAHRDRRRRRSRRSPRASSSRRGASASA